MDDQCGDQIKVASVVQLQCNSHRDTFQSMHQHQFFLSNLADVLRTRCESLVIIRKTIFIQNLPVELNESRYYSIGRIRAKRQLFLSPFVEMLCVEFISTRTERIVENKAIVSCASLHAVTLSTSTIVDEHE